MKRYLFLSLLFIAAVFLPEAASAQTFVTCDGADCQWCNLIDMGNAIIKFIIIIFFVLAGILIAVAGIKLVTSGGNVSAKESAKSLLINAIIGLIIVLAAWLLIDTIIRQLVGDSGQVNGRFWAQIECNWEQTQPQAGVQPPGYSDPEGAPPPDVNEDVPLECSDDDALMARYNGSPVGVEAPGLRPMIDCYLSDSSVRGLTDMNQIYTVDRSHPRCSLTNGNTVCGPCSHSNNSMHYGRGSGEGAKAVDFNAVGGRESELNARLQARRSACGGTLLFEGDHTHISL